MEATKTWNEENARELKKLEMSIQVVKRVRVSMKDEDMDSASSKQVEFEEQMRELIATAPQRPAFWISEGTPAAILDLMRGIRGSLFFHVGEFDDLIDRAHASGFEGLRSLSKKAHDIEDGYAPSRKYNIERQIECLALSMFGTVQPGVIAPLLRGVADGFMERFDFAVYPNVPGIGTAKRDETKTSDVGAALAIGEFGRLLTGYHLMEVSRDEKYGYPRVPNFVFSDEAADRYRAYFDELTERAKTEESGAIGSKILKLRRTCLSLALVYHLFERNLSDMEDEADLRDTHSTLPRISLVTLQYAIATVEFLILHWKRIHRIQFSTKRQDTDNRMVLKDMPKMFSREEFNSKVNGLTGLKTTSDRDDFLQIQIDNGLLQLRYLRENPRSKRAKKMYVKHPVLKRD